MDGEMLSVQPESGNLTVKRIVRWVWIVHQPDHDVTYKLLHMGQTQIERTWGRVEEVPVDSEEEEMRS